MNATLALNLGVTTGGGHVAQAARMTDGRVNANNDVHERGATQR